MRRKSHPLCRQDRSLLRKTQPCLTISLHPAASSGFSGPAPMGGPVFPVFLKAPMMSPATDQVFLQFVKDSIAGRTPSVQSVGISYMYRHTCAGNRSQAPDKECGEFLIGGYRRVTRLGFGAMRITGDGVWGEPADRTEAVRVLRRAVELGINFIDTADSYGPGVSEEIIAEALHPYPAGLVIATKGGYERPGPNQWVENGKQEHLRSACEASLRRLRLDRIDLYQLHRIDPKGPAEDQLGTLKDMQTHGKIKHIGLSEVSVKQIHHARTIVPIVIVQNRYTIPDRGSEGVLAYCQQQTLALLP